MSKTAILSVRIVSDAKKAVAGFDTAAKGLSAFESNIKKAAQASSVASGAVVAMGKVALDSASKLEQSSGAVEAVFKDQAEAVKGFAREAAKTVGLSQNEYQEFASVLGSQLKNLGVSHDQLVPKTNRLIGLGADLASMFGGTTSEAVQSLSAVFRGEFDPIEKYGVSIRKADVNARLAAKGLDDLEGDALRLAETEEILAMLTEQTADAQGNFARETTTAAGSAQIAAAEWENAKASLGEALLPVAVMAANALANIAEVAARHPQIFSAAAAAILGVTGTLWGMWAAIKVFQGVRVVASTVAGAWETMKIAMLLANDKIRLSNMTSAAGSVASWVAAAARTVAAWAMMAAQATLHAGKVIAAWAGTAAKAVAGWTVAAARTIAQWAMMAAQATLHAARTAAAWVASTSRAIAGFVAQKAAMLAARAATLAMAAAQRVLNLVMNANPIGIVVTAVTALAGALIWAYNESEAFRNIVHSIGDWAAGAFQKVIGWIQNAIDWIRGIGNNFQWAMDTASQAANWLLQPLIWIRDRVWDVIDAIRSIDWPSPPRWVSELFAGSTADFLGVPATGDVLRFMASPGLTGATTPELTAAAPSILGYTPARGGRGGGSVTIDNSITVTVDGSGVVDERAVGEAVIRAIKGDMRTRGLTLQQVLA